jgi:hypothetical protein
MNTTHIHAIANLLRRSGAVALVAIVAAGLAVGVVATTTAHAEPPAHQPGTACHASNSDGDTVNVGTYDSRGYCCGPPPSSVCINCTSTNSTCDDGAQPLSVAPSLLGSNLTTTVGVPVNVPVTVSGGTPPYTLTMTGLPPGLTYTSSQISGTTTVPGTFAVSATVRDAAGASATSSFTWTVDVTVPNLLSDSRSEAISVITALGLIPSVSYQKACIDPGAVLAQHPGAGAAVALGSTVYLTIDSGTRLTCILK